MSLVLVAHILLLVVMKRRPINKNMSALNTLAADGKQGNWQLFPYVVNENTEEDYLPEAQHKYDLCNQLPQILELLIFTNYLRNTYPRRLLDSGCDLKISFLGESGFFKTSQLHTSWRSHIQNTWAAQIRLNRLSKKGGHNVGWVGEKDWVWTELGKGNIWSKHIVQNSQGK